jgi:hypothetical protein
VVTIVFVVGELFSGLVVCNPSFPLLRDDRFRRSASFPSLFESDGVVDRTSIDGASEAFSAVSPEVDVSRGFFVLVSTSLPFSFPLASERVETPSSSLFGLRLLLSFSFISARLRESLASLVSPPVDGVELERRDPDSLPLSRLLKAVSAFAFLSARARRRASLSSLLSGTSGLTLLPEDEDDLLLDREPFVLSSVS